MKRRSFLTSAAGSVLATTYAARAKGLPVSQDAVPSGAFEIVAAFPDPDPSGIAVLANGRVFVGFPRHAENHSKAALAELRGSHLIPYPKC